MKLGQWVGVCTLLALASCSVARQAGYVTGLSGAEDLVAVPGTPWIVTSGLADPGKPGGLHAIDSKKLEARRLFPDASVTVAFDAQAWPDCPGPPDPARFSAHGLALREGRLLVMNHGEREAVEVFTFTDGAHGPVLTWQGCIVLPNGALGNGVTGLPDGAIAATLMNAPELFDGPAGVDNPGAWVPRLAEGRTTGYAAIWRKGRGWTKIAGTEGSGPNGIEASADGRTVWVALWGNRQLVRAALTPGGSAMRVEAGFMPDNLRMGHDGQIWVAGASGAAKDYFACGARKGCVNPFALARLDPDSGKLTRVVPRGLDGFGDATSALRVRDKVWIAAHPSERVAWMVLDK